MARAEVTRGLDPVAGPLLAVLALLAGGCGRSEPPGDPDPAERPPGRVLLLGLDGADWDRINPLAAEGRLPHFARLRAEGATGVLLSEDPMLSPILWTSIATGRRPLDHGVLSFLTRDGDGREIPVTSRQVRVKTLWEVLSEHGRSSGVVGWYATWPAVEVNGFVVSDRVGGHQVGRDAPPPTAGLAHPGDLLGVLDEESRAAAVVPARDLLPFFRLTAEEAAGRVEVRIDRGLLESFAAIHRGVRLHARLGLRLWRERPTDLLALYLEAPDAVLHLFAPYEPPLREGIDAELFERFHEVDARYLEYLDGVLGEVLQVLGPADTLVLVSDHGFRAGAARPPGSARAGTGHAPAWHHREGLIALYGAGARRGVRLPAASLYDVAPTVLRLLDLPVAKELAGRSVDDALTDTVRGRAPRAVAAYGPPRRDPDAALPDDPTAGARIDLLKSLGYLGGAGGGPAEGPGGLQETYNRGLALLFADDLDGAENAFAEVERLAPERGLAAMGRGEVAWRRGDLEGAEGWFDRASRKLPGELLPLLNRGLVRLGLGRLDAAGKDFAEVLARDGTVFAAHRGLGEIALRRDRPGEALAPLRRASEVAASASQRADAAYLSGMALLRLGRPAEAEERLREVLREWPGHPEALFRLADLAMRAGRPGEAVELLEALIRTVPEDPRPRRFLAEALRAAGREAEALELERGGAPGS